MDLMKPVPEPDVFLIFSQGMQGCLEAQGVQVRVIPVCNASLPAQRWKWVSRNRLFNLGAMQCLGTGWPATNTTVSLGMYECDREALSLRWQCRTLGDQLSLLLGARANNASKPGTLERGDQTRSGHWNIYGSEEDLCARPYYEVYTIQGNSHGKPCTIPFKYDNQWFHGCTSTGREDGHLWCATTQDYGKDERWGFCPIKSNDCETFWDKDQLTDSCYQFNFQSTLSWREAWASCEQQGADLLSITEIHEQTYINGLLTGYSSTLWIGLNDLDTSGGWQWSDNSPLKYLNWESDQPDNPGEENCGVIRTESSGGWQNHDCSIALPYVCKKKPNATAEPIQPDRWANVKVECDPSWQPFQGHCYRLQAEKRSWQESKRACLRGGGDLLSIHSMTELEFITKQIKQEVEELWIGLNDLKLQMNFEWSDGSLVSFTHWHPFEPNNFRDSLEDCVTIWGPEGRWNDSPCNQSLPSICKKAGRLSQGTAEEDHGCRKVFSSERLQEKKSWIEALGVCRELGAQLLSLASYEEEHFVANMLNKIFGESEPENHEQHWFWIGLNRRDPREGHSWRWSDGLGFSYHNFARSQHDDDNIRGCAVLDLASLQWVAMQCQTQLDWICKIPRGVDVREPDIGRQGRLEWVRFQEAEYKFFEHHSSWAQAQRICTWFQAELTSVHSQAELDFLGQNMQKLSSDQEQHWWIGLHTSESDGRFRWSDGSVINFVSWAPGKPRPIGKDKKCVYMTARQEDWGDQRCHTALPYICKRSNSSGETRPHDLPPSTLGGCPSGWNQFLNKGSRRYSWLSEEPLNYASWQDGEPQHTGGCAYVDVDGTWRTTSCDTKLQGAVCGVSRAGGTVLSILDEMENVFVWEHLQTAETQSRGAWLGMNFNPKGGMLVWQDNTAVNYSNWGPPGLGPSMLSHNSCYWIQSSSGLWRPGACTNVTMGVVCKLPRVEENGFLPTAALPENPVALVVVLTAAVLLLLALLTGALILYRRRQSAERGSFEGARYSRSSRSGPAEATEKNILVSDMEMNEQQE